MGKALRRGRVALRAWSAPLAALVLSGCGATAGGSSLPWPVELPFWCLLTAAAGLHRPLRGVGLGLGTLIVPVAIARLGVSGAVLTVIAARLAISLFRQGARHTRSGEPLTQGMGSAVVAGIAVALAAGSSSLVASWGLFWQSVTLALIYVASYVLLTLGVARLPIEHDRWLATNPVGFLALGLDVCGWMLGALIADFATTLGWPRVTIVLIALALLSAEAARNAFARGASDHRVDDFERLHEAHERILAETSGLAGVVQQILVECSNILPIHWFQLELRDEVTSGQLSLETTSWSAGPDGALTEGYPQPEPRPPMLPGVHRRADWRILETPLVAEGEELAVVRLWCDPRQIKASDEELFATLVPQMASSIHRARLDREAKLDPLTGVAVRRLLESGLQRAFRRHRKEGGSLAVIMCDIDHFKSVNDTYGHAAGDEALILVAKALDSERRESDLLCRYGGEEFTLLLDDTQGHAALHLAERLRQRVEAIDLVYEGQSIPLTLSAGVAAFPELFIKTASELLLLADEALYEAKESGRNRCLLNLGRGAYGTIGGKTIGNRSAKVKAAPQFFG